MAVEFLVRTSDVKIFKKGAISQTIRPVGFVWGGLERLPNWLIFRVTDAEEADIEPYTRQWIELFNVWEDESKLYVEYIDIENANRPRLTTKRKAAFKAVLKELGVPGLNVVTGDGRVTIDKVITLDELRGAVRDNLETMHRHRRYHVKANGIDNLVARGADLVEMTLAQLESKLVDGLNL